MTIVVGGLLVCAATVWTLSPLSGLDDTDPPIVVVSVEPSPHDAESPDADRLAFNTRAFDAHLWNPPPQPQANQESETAVASREQQRQEDAEQRERQRLVQRLQLIGVIHELDGQSRAVLYDAEEDELHIVADGDALMDHAVRITRADDGSAVELVRGDFVVRMLLESTPGLAGVG